MFTRSTLPDNCLAEKYQQYRHVTVQLLLAGATAFKELHAEAINVEMVANGSEEAVEEKSPEQPVLVAKAEVLQSKTMQGSGIIRGGMRKELSGAVCRHGLDGALVMAGGAAGTGYIFMSHGMLPVTGDIQGDEAHATGGHTATAACALCSTDMRWGGFLHDPVYRASSSCFHVLRFILGPA